MTDLATPTTPRARIFRHLAIAARARLTIASKLKGAGFWRMPDGRPFARLCPRNNLDLVREMRRKVLP